MKTPSRSRCTRCARSWLTAGLVILLSGLAGNALAQTLPGVPDLVAAAQANQQSVPVDQKPLTARQAIPPDIVLMLDDSGSMAWDYMPDWQYIGHCATSGDNYCSPTINELRDAKINGTYYSPDVIYTPPPKADSTNAVPDNYPDSPGLGNAFDNGFTDQSANDEVDVTEYPWKAGDHNDVRNGSYVYNTEFQAQAGVEYPAVPGCSKGEVLDGGVCYKTTTSYYDATHIPGRGRHNVDDYKCNAGDKGPFWVSGGWYGSGDYECKKITKTATDDPVVQNTCHAGDSYNKDDEKCVTGSDTTAYLFTYATDDGKGNFTQHYVAKSATDCAIAEADDPGVDCDSSPATQQNVANWFSYYRTRMLLAKSGLMEAFSGMSAKYRFGFASINGRSASWIKQNITDYYPFSTAFKSNNYLAEVQPFGDGSSGTQKAQFWQWIVNETPYNGTPLREALNAVGKYYKTDQPWSSMSSDPGYKAGTKTQLACRQAYTIMTTDGFWNSGKVNVGDVDSANGTRVAGPNENSFAYNARAPFDDGQPNTLADVAMYYWEHDLMSGIENEVPTNAADPAFWQHMITFTIGMGFTPSDASGNPITKNWVADLLTWSTTKKKPDDLAKWGGWPVPNGSGNGSINNVADLVHAGIDGHGGFFSATNPASFTSGLQSALNRAKVSNGTGASLAANSTQLKTGTVAYQAVYHTSIWTGQLEAFTVDPVTGKIDSSLNWDAFKSMPVPADRNIYTYNPNAGTYVAFKNSGTTLPALSTAELDALGDNATDRASMIDYLRGDTSKDEDHYGPYRDRKTLKGLKNVLGDIVDSQPVYVGSVNANEFTGRTFTGSDTFNQFVTNELARAGRIYVAANDGMLHGFNVSTGEEKYAYLPAAVITHGSTTGGISQLANPNYGTTAMPHQYFNDGQLTVADAYFDNAWHSVLVGTTGRGNAKAIYALDVTNPADIKFLWERSAYTNSATCPNCAYIGQMTGKPIIAQVGNGQWAVLIGNGYNSAKDQAALLQFKLSDGTLTVHTAGTDTANGLASPAVWIGDKADDISTVAYAGDLLGHVWSFQLSKAAKNADGTYTITSTPSSSGTKLFTATDGGKAQPITAGMLVGRDPDTSNLWVFFGTGRYLAAKDITDTNVQSWYGLIVQSSNQTLVGNLASEGRSALASRSIIAQIPGSTTKNADGTVTVTLPTRVITPAGKATSMDGKSGWYIDLETPTMDSTGGVTGYVAEGERMVAPSQFQGSRLVGTSIVPKSTDLCNPSGTGWIMAVEPFTGTNPKPQFYDVNGDGVINSKDKVKVGDTYYAAAGVGFKSLPNAPIFVGGAMLTSFDNGTTSSVMTSGAGGTLKRVSWREMVNP